MFPPGGLNTLSRALVAHLVPLQGEPLVNVSESTSTVHAPTDAVSRSTASTNRRQVFHSSPHYVSPTNPMSVCVCFTIANSISLASYLGAEFKEVVKNPIIEYKQANLTVACTPFQPAFSQRNSRFPPKLAIVESTFDPPEGQEPYSYVFDLSGEIRWDRPEQVWIYAAMNLLKC
jgi:hypothetical protein